MKEWRQKEKNKDLKSVLCHESVFPRWLLLPPTLHYQISNTQNDLRAQRQTRRREFIARDKHYGKWRIIGNWLFTAEHPGDLTYYREAIATLGVTCRNGFFHHLLTVRSQHLSTSTETMLPSHSWLFSHFGSSWPSHALFSPNSPSHLLCSTSSLWVPYIHVLWGDLRGLFGCHDLLESCYCLNFSP